MNSLAVKTHYPILDGLRGVAALTVVFFHIFEPHATTHSDQLINHGYLAVDFFFLLSGFVIGYAYDDRWGTAGRLGNVSGSGKMTVTDFFTRRLVRLQPMVVIGMIVGAVCFYFQASDFWPLIEKTPVWKMLLIMVIGCTMIPVPAALDIRGWQETYPLNGPAWSLFYEYIVNILYGLWIRKFSKAALSILVALSGCALVYHTVSWGSVNGGWALDPLQVRIGFTRVMYPFFAGLLLFRVTLLNRIKNAFLLCTLLILAVLAVPRIGGTEHVWMNGIYEAVSILLIFPLIVYLGASGELENGFSKRLCKFLGDISYPLYITHFPFVYIYSAWVHDNRVPLQKGLPFGLLIFFGAIGFAYLCLKWYDEPVRRWLKRKVEDGTYPKKGTRHLPT